MQAVAEDLRVGTTGRRADFGCHSLMQRDVRRSMAVLELLAGAARARIVAARSRRRFELPQSVPWGAAGKPVGMDVASRRGNPVNKNLMACNAILVRVDQLLQPFPAAFGTVEPATAPLPVVCENCIRPRFASFARFGRCF